MASPRSRKRKSAGRVGGEDDDRSPVDPVLPEKKRARRRLVGAVALVLAVVIGLPMVLDSEPKPLSDDLTIEIPSKDKPAAPARSAPTPEMPPKSGALQPATRVAAAAALDQKEELVEMPAVPKSVAPAVAPAAPTKNPEPAPPRASVKPKADAKADAKAEPTVVVPTEKAGDGGRAKSILEAGNEPKASTYAVQVAALASTEKVNELRGKLKSAGIASYTQKITTDNGERIRIRIGPLNSREEADKVRAKLIALGLNGTLVPSAL